jgi:DNA polymerase III delta subunit
MKKLKKLIESNNIPRLMFFIGEEQALKDIYISRIAKVLNLPVKYNTNNRMGGLFKTPAIYVLSELEDVEDDYCIISLDSIDERTKLYKENKDKIYKFNRLSTAELIQYITTNYSLTEQQANDLAIVCRNNFSAIRKELHKFENYPEQDYKQFRKTIYIAPPKDVMFLLVESILTKNMKTLPVYLSYCEQSGESNMAILKALYSNARNTLQVQTTNGDLEKNTGLSKGQIYYAKQRVGFFTDTELIDMLKLINSLMVKVQEGVLDEAIILKYFLCNIYKKD